jgi:hypothetical protein
MHENTLRLTSVCGRVTERIHKRLRLPLAVLFTCLLSFLGGQVFGQSSQSCYVWSADPRFDTPSADGTYICQQWTNWFLTSGGYAGYITSINPTTAPTADWDQLVCKIEESDGGGIYTPTSYTVGTSSGDCEYFLRGDALSASKDLVGDPINPGVGAVTKIEEDGTFAAAGSTLKFDRFYNSNDYTGTDMGPGWRHSYDRSVSIVTGTIGAQYTLLADTSPEYSDPGTACASGFAALQSQVPGWQSGAVSYQGGLCQLTSSNGQLSTIPIYSTYPYSNGSSPPAVEYDAIRDDGTIIRFPVVNGVITSPPGVAMQFAVDYPYFTLTDEDGNVEQYNGWGVLRSITSRTGVVVTFGQQANG